MRRAHFAFAFGTTALVGGSACTALISLDDLRTQLASASSGAGGMGGAGGAGGTGGQGGVAQLALGADHTCALKADGSVWCWGANDYGQLGLGAKDDQAHVKPQQVPNFIAVAIAAGSKSSCAVLPDATVWCWGRNDRGQLGDRTTTDRAAPTAVPGLGDVAQVALGGALDSNTLAPLFGHACARTKDGGVWCWGDNSAGQLGLGSVDMAPHATPQLVSGLSSVADLALGQLHGCARRKDGIILCWGANDKGQLGDGTQTYRDSPVPALGLSGATALAAGSAHTCAVAAGQVFCWGDNFEGQVGNVGAMAASPAAVPKVSDVVAVAAGAASSCALENDGAMFCWGDATILTDGTRMDSSMPTPAALPTPAAQIAAGQQRACAIDKKGAVYCWGLNLAGEVGDGSSLARPTPEPVALPDVQSIALGWFHSCASTSSDALWCWGNNQDGQLGNGTTKDAHLPVGVLLPPEAGSMTQFTTGDVFACAVFPGVFACWGDNQYGQIGDGNYTGVALPGVETGYSFIAVARGGEAAHACALDMAGSVDCWGDNEYGQLGDGTNDNRPAPKAVQGLSGVAQLAVGNGHTCARTMAGSVYCWGWNMYGQLGDGTTVDRNQPGLVPGLANVADIAAGGFHSCAVKTDGSVWCWGSSNAGQIGDGTQLQRLQPVRVPGISDAAGIALGSIHSCAMRMGGGVLCWGDNEYGQLGFGGVDLFAHPLPQAVPSFSGASQIAAGRYHTCALKPGGSAWCWGDNEYGQIGDGGAGIELLPVPVLGL